jgi:hypothetical protein
MESDSDRGRAKNMLLLLLGMQGKKERTTFGGEEARRRRHGRAAQWRSLSLRCLVNSKTAVQQSRATLGANCGEHSVVMASTKAPKRVSPVVRCVLLRGWKIDRKIYLLNLLGDYAVRSNSAERAAYIYASTYTSKHPSSYSTTPSDLMHAARDAGTCRRRCQICQAVSA